VIRVFPEVSEQRVCTMVKISPTVIFGVTRCQVTSVRNRIMQSQNMLTNLENRRLQLVCGENLKSTLFFFERHFLPEIVE
jgi:hypothetical protein